MKPTLKVLSKDEEKRIIREALRILENPGITISNSECLDLLAAAGAAVDLDSQTASIPEDVIFSSLETCPSEFSLYDLQGYPAVQYGGDRTFYNPGSSTLYILDSQTQITRPVFTQDLVQFVQLVERLPQIDAQSTAMIPCEVPEAIKDLYRLYLALNYMTKPIVTGIFRKESWKVMQELLETAAGGKQALVQRPIAIFDICPTSPLQWHPASCQNILDNARSGIPIQFVSMPMAGATAPVTLAGTVIQHTAECLSGIVLAQLSKKGSKVVWGGSAAVFDMKFSSAPMGAPGTWLIASAYTQVGRSLELPTQAYLGISDAKILDAQAGMESAAGALLGSLVGLNMISGAGMLAYENCQSPEKLILDAEMISSIKHYAKGIQFREDPLAVDLLREIGTGGDFLSHNHTFKWFKDEMFYPSPVIDRQVLHPGGQDQQQSAWTRAQKQREELLQTPSQPALTPDIQAELRRIATKAAQAAGMDKLPPLPPAAE